GDLTPVDDAYSLDHRQGRGVRDQLVEVKQNTVFPKKSMTMGRITNVVVGVSDDLATGVDRHTLGAKVSKNDAEIGDFAVMPENRVKDGISDNERCACHVSDIIDSLRFCSSASKNKQINHLTVPTEPQEGML